MRGKRAGISAFAALVLAAIYCCQTVQEKQRPYLASAKKAAHWLQSVGQKKETGTVWPADPEKPDTIPMNLYSGTAGVVLFFLELYRTTGEETYLMEAEAGADSLIASLPEEKVHPGQTGLYTGLAGRGFVLGEVYKASDREKYREGTLRCVQILHKSAERAGAGAQWGEVTDIIAGSAGIGLFLLYAAEEMEHPPSKALAVQAGRRLLELGIPEQGGMKWRMDPDYPRLMPNFSHGTAGIAYFLAALFRETKEEAFLKGAVAGAEHLLNITNENGLIHHHEPGGEDLFYLGWCHGPTGTARLYYLLWKETDNAKWHKALLASAGGAMQSGIPEKRTEGFWDNAGQCCGSAGVGEFFLSLHRETGSSECLDFAQRCAADLLSRSTTEGEGVKWIHAEHRARPKLLVAQTGYMQGAAGIGMFLLHLDAAEQGKKPAIRFPDDPWE